MTPEDVAAWTYHDTFNAWRYGLTRFQDVTPTCPTAEEVQRFLDWAETWDTNGVPG